MNGEHNNLDSTTISQDVYFEKRAFFDTGNTKPYNFRINQLKKLKASVIAYENEILDALYADFKKPRFEAFTGEVGVLYEEIDFAIKNLKKWMKPKKVSTPIVL